MTPHSEKLAHPSTSTQMLLVVGLVSTSFITTALGPVLPMLATYFGGGVDGEILAQRAQALPFLGQAIGGLIAGALVSRLHLKLGLLVGALGYGLAGLIAGLATKAEFILSAFFVLGLFASMLNTGLAAATGRTFEEGPGRTRILAFQIALSDFAAITASLVAGVVAQFVGWRAPLAIYPVFACYILCFLALSRIPPAKTDVPVRNGLATALRAAWPVHLAPAVLMIFIAAQGALLPFHLAANGITTASGRAIVLTATPVAAMIASTSYGLIRGRVDDRKLFLLSILCSVFGYAGIAVWSATLPLAALSTAATGIGIGLTVPVVIRAAFSRVPSNLHGHSMGLVTTSTNIGAFASPLLLGPLMRAIGGQALFLGFAAAWWVGGLLLFFYVRPNVRTQGSNSRL